jgi:hypothetical protein
MRRRNFIAMLGGIVLARPDAALGPVRRFFWWDASGPVSFWAYRSSSSRQSWRAGPGPALTAAPAASSLRVASRVMPCRRRKPCETIRRRSYLIPPRRRSAPSAASLPNAESRAAFSAAAPEAVRRPSDAPDHVAAVLRLYLLADDRDDRLWPDPLAFRSALAARNPSIRFGTAPVAPGAHRQTRMVTTGSALPSCGDPAPSRRCQRSLDAWRRQ